MIIKDASQDGAVVPKNRDAHYLLCNFLATPFLCCCHLVLLQLELIEYFPLQEQNLFTLPRWGRRLVAFGVQQTLFQTIFCRSFFNEKRR